MTLCATFQRLARKTYRDLKAARRVGYQVAEETITDMHMLHLKVRHPTEIFCHTFTKAAEGSVGADWDWWLTSTQSSSWLGIRIQAKVLDLRRDRFTHLHYRSGTQREFQAEKLKRSCIRDGMVPLYCLYLHQKPAALQPFAKCGTFPFSADDFGCSLIALSHVEALRAERQEDGFTAVMRTAFPWHCLICCQGYGQGALAERAWHFLQGAFRVPPFDPRSEYSDLRPGPRPRPPEYVMAVMENAEQIEVPRSLRGVLIIREVESR